MNETNQNENQPENRQEVAKVVENVTVKALQEVCFGII